MMSLSGQGVRPGGVGMRYFDRRQNGLTFLSTLLLLVVIGFFAYLAIKLVPIYLEYFNVTSSLNSLASEQSQGLTRTELRESLMKRLQVNDVKHVDRRNIKIQREAGGHVVSVEYDVQEKFYGNVYLLISFNESVTISPH